MRIFKKKNQIKKDTSKVDVSPQNDLGEKKVIKSFDNPYLDQLHRLYEDSLLNDEDMEDAHNVSQFLLKNPEFYPIEEEEEEKPTKDVDDKEEKE
jgi:hypothetical protein